MLTVRYTMKPVPRATQAKAAVFENRHDSEIDYSDIPPMTDEELARMVPWHEAQKIRAEHKKQALSPVNTG